MSIFVCCIFAFPVGKNIRTLGVTKICEHSFRRRTEWDDKFCNSPDWSLSLQQVISRKVLVDDGSRQVIELEQAATWRFLLWSGSITIQVLIDQNREDHSVRTNCYSLKQPLVFIYPYRMFLLDLIDKSFSSNWHLIGCVAGHFSLPIVLALGWFGFRLGLLGFGQVQSCRSLYFFKIDLSQKCKQFLVKRTLSQVRSFLFNVDPRGRDVCRGKTFYIWEST